MVESRKAAPPWPLGLMNMARRPRPEKSAAKDTERKARRGKSAKGGRAIPSGLAARQVAAALVRRILHEGTPLGEALARESGALEALSAPDRALAQNIARTTLRRSGQLDEAIGRFVKKPLAKKAALARAILRIGAAQVLFMRIPAHAAIDTAVRLAKADAAARPLAGLINAVLRNISRQSDGILKSQDAFACNIPVWLRRNWIAAYGEHTARRIASSLLKEPALDVTVKDPAQAARWAKALDAHVLPTGSLRLDRGGRAIPSLPGFAQGAWWAQDAAAALPVRLLGDIAGKRVLDMCAAPGGKTAQLAAAGAHVTALDMSARRLERLRENLARLNLEADIVCADALTWQPETPFDAIVLDAPCTATGTARRHPEVLHLKTPGQMTELMALQGAMLERALGMLQPGGKLIYCVCSLQPQEGEMRIAQVLQDHADQVRRLPIAAQELAGQTQMITPQGDLRTLPCMAIGEETGLDGFFAARLTRLQGRLATAPSWSRPFQDTKRAP